jgi:hypothetical protein
LARLQFSSEDQCPSGWEVVRLLWVVRCVADYPSDANGRLGLKAFSIGGNALIERKFAIIHSLDRLPTGLDRADELRAFEEQLSRTSDGAIKVEKVWRGPVKVWEAMAVDAREIDALAHAPAAPPAQQADLAPPAGKADRPAAQSPPTALDPDHDKLVIDGNNLLRETCDPLNGEVKFDTAVLKKIADHLEQSGFDYHVFFDANIHWLLLDRRAGDEEIAALTGFPKGKFNRVPRGQEAGTFILDYAGETGAVILSNDYFEKYRATYDFLDDPSRKTGYTRSGPLVLIPRLASIRI